MTTILIFALPLFGWTFVLASMAAHFRNNLFYFAAVGFNLLALWLMRTPATADMIWLCLFCAVAIAILLVIDRVARDYDLLMTVYTHWLSRTLLIATTIWWLTALIVR
ncbi:hypothetical protein [Lacticaseibacillus absianus]|uniref:hypothetical protein n=1 Tax=Lacticaseibacillus absianus TaxID=2729623 RepID=UPI0015CC1374|nr:hypothetical protein [Lacticaseibacillus absianus]